MSFHTLFMLIIIAVFTSCSSPSHVSYGEMPTHQNHSSPDYSMLDNWAAHPWKYDPSDSTPLPYRSYQKDTTVDVFFIHPTTYTNTAAIANKSYASGYWNANLNDASLNENTDNSSILNQASTFNKYRVFAPRYRQAHLESFHLPDSIAAPFFDTAYSDVKQAFELYLEHYNHGRPFVIASHSQGTLHAGRLLKEVIEGKKLQQKLIAAYIIGLAVPASYFERIRVCEDSTATGCFVTWRTYKKGYTPPWVLKEKEPSWVVNPINWTTDTNWVSREFQKGAVLYNFNKPRSKSLGAGIHGNILWSSKPRFFGNVLLTRKNYHIGDINLFWKDIRDNLDARVNAYRNN